MDDGLIEHLRELAEPIGGVSFRKMFGGWGVFRDGLMFALVIDDVLYFKVDAETTGLFEAEALEHFSYKSKDGKPMQVGYRRAPERVFDDPDDFRLWAGHGMTAAGRAALAKPAQKRPPAKAKTIKG